jgi:hypothetical protein
VNEVPVEDVAQDIAPLEADASAPSEREGVPAEGGPADAAPVDLGPSEGAVDEVPLPDAAAGEPPVHRVDPGEMLSGFVEVRGQFFVGTEGKSWQLVQRVRPTFEIPLSTRVSVTATLEVGLAEGRNSVDEFRKILEDSPVGPLIDAACTWPDPENDLFQIDGLSDYAAVDRLYVDLYLPGIDLRLGRQAVRWGSAQVVNPTDPFPQVLLSTPWAPRAGINAARATIPVGENNTIQAVLGTDDVFKQVRGALRATATHWNTDFSVVGVYRGDLDEGVVGVDIRGTLGVGYWVEAAARLSTPDDDGRVSADEQIAVGLDYSFPLGDGSLILSAEYYRNGAGVQTPDPLAGSLGAIGSSANGPQCEGLDALLPASSSGGRLPSLPFAGRDYAFLTAAAAPLPEFSASVAGLWNLGDGSGMLIPTLTGRPLGWWDVSLAAQIPFSTWREGGELHPSDDQLTLSLPVGGDLSLSGLVPDLSVIAWTRANF